MSFTFNIPKLCCSPCGNWNKLLEPRKCVWLLHSVIFLFHGQPTASAAEQWRSLNLQGPLDLTCLLH